MPIMSAPLGILPNVGMPELLVIFLILLLLFGASRLAGIGNALGKTIREFRRELRDVDEDVREERRPRESSS
jgi:sec-independent protein translocase protein TatA